MRDGSRLRLLLALGAIALAVGPGCASMRCRAPDPFHRPCADGFAYTKDGWRLGIRRIRPARPDPGKLPVVLCHGLGLNGTFWTITDHHLPSQLAARGYEVFIPDLRGSGLSQRVGPIGRVNALLRETPLPEVGEGRWTIDDQIYYDVPAILDHIKRETGHDRVNWVGHSLGGMLMFAHLETTPRPDRIANLVAMGAPITMANAPDRDMLRANRAIRMMLRFIATGRMARPLMYFRPSGLERVDGFYFSSQNVDRKTIDRFYAYTLENLGRGALKQFEPFFEFGHLLSADGHYDYVLGLHRVKTPTLMVAGEADAMYSIASTLQTFNALGSPDKTLLRFGKQHGQIADYGHCDLVWSRYAPVEIFPVVADWLDRRQPGVTGIWPVQPSPQRPLDVSPSPQQGIETDLRPALEVPTPQVQVR
ncbi:MAG: alpha/beta fold hydrolase [Isosphaeraceae bacterium]|nr:alpha/beta fold hydrolase [Isosphaeraceae bacterium]